MAPPVGTLRVGRYFLSLLAIFALLYLIVFFPGARHTPKLGLDLEGGTQVIFTAKTTNGKAPTSSSMSQAKHIMTDRVNGTGVTEATVVVQGSDQLVVSIPGSTDTDVSKLGAAAVLNFRGLVTAPVPVTCVPSTAGNASPSTSNSPSPSAAKQSAPAANKLSGVTVNDAGHHLLTPPQNKTTTPSAPSATPKTTPAAPATSPQTAPSGASTAAPAAQKCSATPFAALEKSGVKIPTSDTEFNKLSTTQQGQISAALANFDCASAQTEPDLAEKYYVACDDGKSYGQPVAFLLGTVIVPGHEIKTATAVPPNLGTAGGSTTWTVSLSLKSTGQTSWAKYTTAHNIGNSDPANTPSPTTCGASATPCADFVGFTLDGMVISTPVNMSAINGGQTQISGSFTQSTAKDLANQLKYGALPLTFKADQAQTVSATLGTSQLKSGFLAGGIGLALVIVYSLLYYRALGLVTIASLMVSAVLIYGSLVMLGSQMGFTLSLAGIAGFIVAIGITADSFVVFFERIKDEVHQGRSMRVAVPRAWTRARRTIISADTVSVLAAAVLYYFAAGDVKGFAFTLGLSTILDIIVVFLFTHPLVSWLSRKKAFGSARFTGLNSVREGGIVPSKPSEQLTPASKPRRSAKAQPVEPRTPTGKITLDKSSIAVLERERDTGGATPEAHEPDSAGDAAPSHATDTPATRGTDNAAQSSSGAGEAQVDGEQAAGEQAETVRKRTKPAPGSAAERAAARRARLREKGEK